MIEINLAKAKEMIAGVVAERGEDYVYPMNNCTYIHEAGKKRYQRDDSLSGYTPEEDEPGCGVGLAVINLGVPLEWFKEGAVLEDEVEIGTNNNGDVRTLAWNLEGQGVAKMTDSAITYLKAFQLKQDDGIPWGQAKDYADGVSLSRFSDSFIHISDRDDFETVMYKALDI